MAKVCTKCHSEVHEEVSQCPKCGNRMTVIEQGRRYCPAGKHPMDPAWPSCPYCSDSETASQQPPPTPTPHGQRRKTEAENDVLPRVSARSSGESRQGRKGTHFDAALAEPGTPTIHQDREMVGTGRRMVAVVVTYTWKPEGQLFAVFEGRNYIGKDPDCEIRLIADQTMSGKHAAIFYRSRAFFITDEKSMNGTFVNGVEAPLTGIPIGNYDEIRTGATVWKFIVIEPPVTNGAE